MWKYAVEKKKKKKNKNKRKRNEGAAVWIEEEKI
jgi:hypothetical protein